MALGRRTKPEQTEVPPPMEPTAPPVNETFLDEGCSLSGELRFSGNVRIDGRVEGEMTAQKGAVIGERAEIHAKIDAETLEVFGTVLGDIRVTRRTTLHKTARVEGEIQTSGIVIEEGAHFKGRIVIGSDGETTAASAPNGGSDADVAHAMAEIPSS